MLDGKCLVDAGTRNELHKFQECAVRILNAVIEHFSGEQMSADGFGTLRSAVLLMASMKMHCRLSDNSFIKFINDRNAEAYLQRLKIRSADAFWRLNALQMCKVRK